MKQETHAIRILIAEDLSTDAELAIREIKKENIDFTYRVVDTEKEFRKELSDFAPDIVISDYSMPVFDGMSALKITRAFNRYLPFVVLTGSMNEETAVECMKAGANDYVIKEQITRLPFAVLEAIGKRETQVEKVRVQKELLESEAKYRSLIENSNDAIYLIYNRKFELINPGFEEMFGYSLAEVKQPGFDFIQLIAPESKTFIEERLRKAMAGEKVDHLYEFTAIDKNGVKKEVEASVSSIDFKNGKAIQGIIRDISERKKMITDLMKAKEKAEESDKLKTAFLANISHEIRTPMNGIMGFTELLKDPDMTGDQQQNFIDVIQQSGNRMLETVDNLIDISIIETGQAQIQIKETNINEQLEYLYDFFKPLADEKGLNLIFNNRLPESLARIKTDIQKLNSILTNLIKNSVKFTDSGEIVVDCNLKGSRLEFHVKDTGRGIPLTRQEVIFNRFEQADTSYTRAIEGSGLGLSIAKSYIEMLGGEIRVKSEEGKGSLFCFSLPYQVEDHDPIIPAPDKESLKTTDKILKILVAEDDETSSLYLLTLLKESGFETIHTITGNETVELCRKHPDIDIILMDINMPVMNGYDATLKIREFNKDVFIIAQTAHALEGDKKKALESGCNEYITKPIKRKGLFDIINQL